MTTEAFNPGVVDWSGENPGIYLRDTESSPWLSLCVFFRVVLSDHGRGTGVVLIGAPAENKGVSHNNVCISDNEPLMRYLVKEFVTKFGSFREATGLQAMTYLPLVDCTTSARGSDSYSEVIRADSVEVALRWEQLGVPFAADVPVERSPTNAHQMYSVFREAKQASISVNGKPLPGRVTLRDFHGRRTTTAFLAFSETWIRHSQLA